MTSFSFKSPEPFNPASTNPAAEWTDYKDSFKIYALAAKLADEATDVQIAIFLHILGPAGRRIYNTLSIPIPPDGPLLTLDRIYGAFDAYYEPYKNLTAARYAFLTTKQGTHQPFDAFITDIKTKARQCDFGILTASLTCTQIIIGIRNEKLRKELLADRQITLERAIATCQATEAAAQHATAITTPIDKETATSTALDAINRSDRRLQQRAQHHPRYGRPNQQSVHERLTAAHSRNNSQPATQPRTTPHTYSRRPQQPTNSHSRQQQGCSNCGTNHPHNRCPAQNAQCFQCSRRGHWASLCRSRSVNEVTTYHDRQSDDEYNADFEGYQYTEDDTYHCTALALYCHDTSSPLTQNDEWHEEIYFANFPVLMKLDTGSQVNIIHTGIYEQFPIKPVLHKPPYAVRAYSGHLIDIVGVIYIRCASFAAGSHQCFYVTPHKTMPILGAKATVDLGLIKRNRKSRQAKSVRSEDTRPVKNTSMVQQHVDHTSRNSLQKEHPNPIKITTREETHQAKTNTQQAVVHGPIPPQHIIDKLSPEEIVLRYQDVFDRIGKLPGKHKIHLKPNAVPTISAPRQIPFALQEPVAQELHRLQDLGIIKPVTGPTDWVHPMVVVRQEHKPIPVRICLDPRNLNAAIRLEPYPTPTAQEIFSNLHGAEIFTVLDAQSAFWQVELDEESSHLCTFATPFGRYRFVRLALGICTSSSIFQRIMHSIFPPAKFPTTHISTDDFLLATTKNLHNRTLVTILDLARHNGLTFSSTKMQLAVCKITYLGLTITPKGLEIAPTKIQAIQAIPAPQDRQALQRFLGMVNFLAKFVPQHSTETGPLRALLKKSASFTWDANSQATFDSLKRLITTAPVLAFFNPKTSSTISVDSSKIGVGAVLMQENNPVEYASTSFTETQQNYAPIERELLGILYACERFHYYVVGTRFIVETDHRPLVAIVQKPLHLLSPRLQRLVLKLTRYNLQVKYVPGSLLYVADTLSRAPRPEKDINTTYLEGPSVMVHAMATVLSEDKATSIRNAITTDTISQKLLLYIRQGWPARIDKLHPPLRTFWGIQEELHEIDGLIFRGERLFIPTCQRINTLREIHKAHQGITACLAKARIHVFWPEMTQDITNYIKQCDTCQRRERANVPMPLTPHQIPQRPWEVIATDMFQVADKKMIVLVDYFSKYVEAQEMKSTNAEAIINFLNPHFARHGAPQTLMSDNGPPYNSNHFGHFLQQWGVKHVTSSPHYPQSNGMVERTIQTLKNMLLKAQVDGKDLQQTLMEYRSTPIGDLPSPAEMLMGRRIRTPLTTTTEALRPQFPIKHIQTELQNRQQRMINAQRIAREPQATTLDPGTTVYHWIGPRQWEKAIVISSTAEPHSYIIRTEKNQILRRTRHHLRPTASQESTTHQTIQDRPPIRPQRDAARRPEHKTQNEESQQATTRYYRKTLVRPATHQDERPPSNKEQDQQEQFQTKNHHQPTSKANLDKRRISQQIPPSPFPSNTPPFPSSSDQQQSTRPKRTTQPPTYYQAGYN